MHISLLSLFAFLWLVYGMKLVLDPNGSEAFLKKIRKDEGIQFVLSAVLFSFSFLIFATAGLRFRFELDHLINWLGLIIMLKAMFMLAPGLVERMLKPFKAKHLPIFGFVALLLALVVFYIDLELLAS